MVARAVFVVCLVASTVWCWTAASALGPTFDEHFYVIEGVELWRTGSHGGLLRKGTMPLPVDVATLPIRLVELARGEPFDVRTDLATVLPWARMAAIVFWWLWLAYVWREARDLGGRAAGALAVVLLVVQPVCLGHASLATTDVAAAATVLALVHHFRRLRAIESPRRVWVPGLWFGVALLAKASALVNGPLALVAVDAGRGADFRRLRSDLARIMGIGFAVALVACGSDWKAERSFVAWAAELPDGAARDVMSWIAGRLTMFPNGAEALVRQIRHNIAGHSYGAYLLGEVRESFWYYFPLALTMKLSPALLVPLLATALAWPRALRNPAGVVAAVLVAASVFARVQIGVRLVFPLVGVGAVAVAVAVVRAAREAPLARARAVAAITAAAIAWSAVSCVRVWPQGIAYTNELWGGTQNGYRLLSSANYDWGQGLPELADWHRRHGEPPLAIWYYGTDPARWHLPFESLALQWSPIREPADVLRIVDGRLLAASTTLVYGVFASEAHRRTSEFLRSREPVARTTTFLIYDFRR